MGIESISAIITIAVLVIGGGIILYKKPPARNPISYVLLATGVLLTLFLGFKLYSAEFLQIWLLFVLVVVTSLYAWSTEKMAKEMKNARYDALRPIIDIVNMQQTSLELGRQAYAKKLPNELRCKLCNIGVGPAVELYSFIEDAEGKPRRWDFGALPVAIGTRMTATGEEEIGYTEEMRLLLEHRGNHGALVAYYKDVYGRWFESSREVRLGAVNPDPLQIRKITEEELAK